MAPNPPVRGVQLIFYIGLRNFTSPGRQKANPTIAAGDFLVSKDGGAFANLGTLPTVTPASGRSVKITLSATEMDADSVYVEAVDQTDPPEWCDWSTDILTTA